MSRFLEDNKGALAMFGLSVAMIALSLGVSGCQLDQIIKVNVPRDVQAAISSDEKVPLADSPLLWEQWSSYVSMNTEALKARIGDADGQYRMVSSLTSMGLETAGAAASTLPGGAFIVAGLTGLGGLFLKRPGTDKMVQKEKEDSFNKGLEVGSGGANE